jgi:FAD/FMN-containing dehydrogenase
MPAAELKAQLRDTRQRSWTNKHETYTQPLRTLFDLANPSTGKLLDRYNATTRELQALIGRAVKAGARVRALGGGWSLSRAPATDGWLVNTKLLNLTFQVDKRMVVGGYTGDREGLRFVQCGCSIQELNKRLRSQGRSLRTSGASNGQTIVGALSTGTHGSAFGIGSVQDAVVGLHLIVGANRHVWLERASAPVMSDTFAARLGAEPLRDDALFNAALVSFGSFGVIHGVMLETDELFLLEMHRRRMPLDGALRKCLNSLDFSGLTLPGGAVTPYHFQVVVNPFDLDAGVHVTTLYKRPFQNDYVRAAANAEGFGPGDDAPSFIGLVSDALPVSIPSVVNGVLGRAYGPLDKVQGTLGEIFSNNTLRGKVASAAVGVPVSRSAEVLDTLLDLNRREGPFPILAALRFVKATRATLGWARFEPTCVFELDGPLSSRNLELYQRMWRALRQRGIPHTFHWGKMLELDAARVRGQYGDAVGQWMAARETLLDAKTRRVFSSPFLEELGLAS